jgi:hypothetical protein
MLVYIGFPYYYYMKTRLRNSIIFTFSFILFAFTSSEKRIKEKDVPQAVKDYLTKNYKEFKKPKYYIEIIDDTTYYEVVLKSKQEKLDLLFTKDGVFFELEKAEKFENLPLLVRENITKHLSTVFSSYKILEVEYLNPHLVVEHELQVRGILKGQEKYYEFVFDIDGKVIRSEEVVLVPISSMF